MTSKEVWNFMKESDFRCGRLFFNDSRKQILFLKFPFSESEIKNYSDIYEYTVIRIIEKGKHPWSVSAFIVVAFIWMIFTNDFSWNGIVGALLVYWAIRKFLDLFVVYYEKLQYRVSFYGMDEFRGGFFMKRPSANGIESFYFNYKLKKFEKKIEDIKHTKKLTL